MSINKEDIGKVRKVNISSSPNYTLYEVQFCYKHDCTSPNPEWYDLLEDPPEWLCDIIVKKLNDTQSN